MKYLPLVWANLWRKRVRTILTMISVVVAFLLFGILDGVTSAFDLAVERIRRRHELRTQPRVGSGRMPIAHLQAHRERSGRARGRLHGLLSAAIFRNARTQSTVAAIDASRFTTLMKVIVPDEQMEAMKRTRTGAIIGTELVDRYGWKIGDRVTLTIALDAQRRLDRLGVRHCRRLHAGRGRVSGQRHVLHQLRVFRRGARVRQWLGRTLLGNDRRRGAAQRRSPKTSTGCSPTRQTKHSRRASEDTIHAEINRVGNISFIVNAIVSAVLFALLFVTGNTMMQAIRERTPELAVLKTYGYSNGTLTALVVLEAALLCLTAAGIGLGIAAVVFPSVFDAIGVAALPLESRVVVYGLGFALVLALASALPPAWRAQRLRVVDALAGR